MIYSDEMHLQFPFQLIAVDCIFNYKVLVRIRRN